MDAGGEASVYVAGHRGMVGSALVRRLRCSEVQPILTASRSEVDLTRQAQVEEFFSDRRISEVYLAAAKVGGIHANNSYPAEFIYQNLAIECNVIHAAYRAGVRRLLYLGSSCIYPRDAPQPMSEDSLLTGPLEPTNEPYAVAKIAGLKLCESYRRQYGCDFRSVMPTNLYGPEDNFHPENSHVIPALIRRFDEAARANADEVVIWGSGRARREFLHVDDMAAACLHVMSLSEDTYWTVVRPMCSHINVGTGDDCTIADLASNLAKVTGFKGQVVFDHSKPDGAPRKLLDVSKLFSVGWRPQIGLMQGLSGTYSWFREHLSVIRG